MIPAMPRVGTTCTAPARTRSVAAREFMRDDRVSRCRYKRHLHRFSRSRSSGSAPPLSTSYGRAGAGDGLCRRSGLGLRGRVGLSGSNALGAFQAGVYEALHTTGLQPDWIVGASIPTFRFRYRAARSHPQGCHRLRQAEYPSLFLSLIYWPAWSRRGCACGNVSAPQYRAKLNATRRTRSRASATRGRA